MKGNTDQTVRTFLVSTDFRNISKYPSPADFQFDLPVALANVEGVSIRDYKFSKESLINRNNCNMNLYGKHDTTSFNVTAKFTPGDYSQTTSALLSHMNTRIDNVLTAIHPAKIEFSVDSNTTNMIQVTYTGAVLNDYVVIAANSLLDSLGFSAAGICLYHTTKPVELLNNTNLIFYNIANTNNSALANIPYDLWTTSDMVLRISDVEAILADNSVVNRATAVLFSAGDYTTTSKQCLDHYMPLLQKQSRLQRLHVQLFNMSGQPYDTPNATFLIRFYCKDSSSSAV